MDKLVDKINRLIIRIADGDGGALDELFSITRRMFLHMANKYLYDKSYAEDLLSEVYYKIVKYSSSFDSSYNGLNWMYKILHNTAIDFNNRDRHYEFCELNENISPIEYVDDLLDKILIHSAIDTLDDDEKYVIYLRYWEGLEYKEIAQKINKPLTTTYDYLKRIHKKIHKSLKH